MTLSKLSVRRPVLMTMVYVLICVIAIVFIPQLDIELIPDVEMPVVTVMVDCGTASPDEIETGVAETLETALSSMENLDSMTTQCSEGNCLIVLQFDYGTDIDSAADDVEAAVSRVTRLLPDFVEDTEVLNMNSIASSSSQVMRFMVTGDGYSLNELQDIAENTVAPLFERVEGVSNVDVFGGSSLTYVISVDPAKLYSYGLSLSSVTAAVTGSEVQETMGDLETGTMNYTMVLDGRYTSIEDIEDTVIYTDGSRTVRLGDVATIAIEDDSSSRRSYYNGERVISLSISAESDYSGTRVASNIYEELDGIIAELPVGVTLTLQNDSTQMITDTMDEVYNSAYQGVLLAALIIFLFLRGIKTTLIISLSMPICILITLMLMAIFDLSINMMTMAGLILGIGMIVDASICILENTYTIRQSGEKSAIAAILGSRNMFAAITASTLTTVCVFLPMLIYKNDLEMFGIMFQDMIITVCISLISSLFVAVTLVPALCGSILKINTRTQKPLKNRLLKGIDDSCARAEEKMRNGYVRVLDYCLSHKMLLIVLLVLLLLLSITQFSRMGFSLYPSMTSDDQVGISLTLPAGTDNSVTAEYLFNMQDRIVETLPEGSYESISLSVGSSNTGSITIELPEITEQTYSASEITSMIRTLASQDVGATWIFDYGSNMGGSSAIDIEILSDSSELAMQVSKDIQSILAEYVPQVIDVDSDLDDGAPRLSLKVDRELAQSLGITNSEIATTLSGAFSQNQIGELTAVHSGDTYDLDIKFETGAITTPDEVLSLMVQGDGGLVPLYTIAQFEYTSGPMTILREDGRRVNNITGSLAEGYSASEVQAIVDQALSDHLVLPDGVTLVQSGEMSMFIDYIPTLVMVVLLALFLVYAVMAAQFESLLNPLIVFITIPLLLIGVVAIHVIYGQDFSIMSIVGIISLIGVVVNNGIVLVDCINRLVRNKVPVREACLSAARSRLRPILMTTLTTILGLIPMAFFPGDGAEMMQPIALTFVGGITTGAFLTLLLSPVLYYIFNKRREARFDDPDTLENQLREYDMRKMDLIDDYL